MRSPRRSNPDAIRQKPITLGGHVLLVYVVDDLEDEELQTHFTRAFQKEDYEYCQALAAEAKNRGFNLQIR